VRSSRKEGAKDNSKQLVGAGTQKS
jgi:hypothetical protein